jgi:hypothetical protein
VVVLVSEDGGSAEGGGTEEDGMAAASVRRRVGMSGRAKGRGCVGAQREQSLWESGEGELGQFEFQWARHGEKGNVLRSSADTPVPPLLAADMVGVCLAS